MVFITGFLLWLAFALGAGALVWMLYRTPGTTAVLTFVFAVFGSFIGGMLGMSPYIYHDPAPLRIGGLIGALAGGLLFSAMYQFVAKKGV